MAIVHLQRHAKLAAYGEKIGREEMSKLVIKAVAEWQEHGGTYQGAMFLAGRLKAISQMATLDDYWLEQINKGFMVEYYKVLAARDIAPLAPLACSTKGGA